MRYLKTIMALGESIMVCNIVGYNNIDNKSD